MRSLAVLMLHWARAAMRVPAGMLQGSGPMVWGRIPIEMVPLPVQSGRSGRRTCSLPAAPMPMSRSQSAAYPREMPALPRARISSRMSALVAAVSST